MAYRTYVNGVQIFGNDDHYPEWIGFVRSQGLAVDGDDCYRGEITDVMGAIEACESIVMRIEDERRAERERLAVEKDEDPEIQQLLEARATSQFDLTEIYARVLAQKDAKYGLSLFDRLLNVTRNGYMFVPYALYRACGEHVEFDDGARMRKRLNVLRLKPGHTIPVWAG